MPKRGHSAFSQQCRRAAALGMLLAIGLSSGCMALLSPINGVPAHRLPPQFQAQPKNNLVPIDISRLRQEPPPYYLADAGDILGIYIEGALGAPEEPPPVNTPQQGSDLPPSIGYPIVVREDGTVSVPLVPPLMVRGLTITQVENALRRAYTVDRKILAPGKDRIIVTLLKPREISVVVMRQDGAGQEGQTTQQNILRFEQSTRSEDVKLKAYENDVLHALAATGGLPGLSAKNELKILRSSQLDVQRRDAYVKAFYQLPVEPCLCRPPLPDDAAIVRIPLRLPPGEVPSFRPQDIILNDGDIVLIESREREVFYTGGLMRGGEWPLPRDYDLDVLGALAIAGTGIGGPAGFGGGGGGMGFSPQSIGGAPPGMLYVLRKTPCGDQITIAVDLTRAINSPAARPLVQAGDILILRYKCEEEALNFALGTFFIQGIQRLFQRN